MHCTRKFLRTREKCALYFPSILKTSKVAYFAQQSEEQIFYIIYKMIKKLGGAKFYKHFIIPHTIKLKIAE